ncbi:MAPEG family protein [Devosia sp.]|uniref:MAPEG family protein n=1 Tax=Devosia sp. TaxID=1871048 RepID=UPI003A935DEC
MSIELTLLIWSPVLVGLYVLVQSTLYRLQHGIKFAASGRDGEAPPDAMNSRAEKALRNLLETYAVFVALAVATELSGRSDVLTVWGAQLYFWARIVYLPLYMFAVPYVRSLVWLVSALGLGLMFIGVAF